ncbi:hypothetical protein Pfo_016843 [Paulownia fortunei]|nr:hypothetical protein Pfo_016843 [Paulownia fortunei]
MDLFFIIFLYLPLFLVLYFVTQNLFHKLQNLPPGPFLAFPVIGHIYLLKKTLHKTLHGLSKKYGPVFSLQLGSRLTLVVNSPSAAAECLYKANDAIFANRPRLFVGKHLGYNYTSIVWAPYGDHGRNLRRISSVELLSSHRIQSLSQIRLDEVQTLIRHLFEMRNIIFELLFNVMTTMILGKRYYGKNEVNSEEAKEFQDIITQMHQIVSKSTLDEFIPFLSWFRKTEDNYKAIQERSDKFFQDLIEGIRGRGANHSPSNEKGKTMIEVLLSLQETDPEYYTDEIVKSLTAVLLQAGSDTSVATMEWAMSLLLNNPAVLKKVQSEIDHHVGHDHLIDDSDLSKLPYLHCIISETLRLYPVAPLLLPHESSEDCTIGGFHVPRGMMLLINAWAVQNDPKIWEDPGMFRPERFMTKEGIKEEFKHMPFGTGRRGCPGEALAMRMIGLALSSLLQCFDWQRVSGDLEDMAENSGVVLSKAQPLMARCWPRPSMVNLLSQT